MAGIERRKTWTELLLSLFNLLVDNADGVIDDTSLERILEWLKRVCQNEHQLQNLMQCGTVEFMLKDHVFTNPESTAFFLRLLGFLVSRTEIFHSLKCSKDGDIVSRLLMRPRDEPHLWNEGIVRNGYFQALISLTEHTDGMFWLKDSGSVIHALDCISDRSMFVASSARKFLVKFITKESEWIADQQPHTQDSFIDCSDQLKIIIEKIKLMLIPGISPSTTSEVAAIEVTRILLYENSVHGQKVLQQSKLFMDCLNLLQVGDLGVCQKLVDMICEISKNSTCPVDWYKLTTMENTVTTGSEVLLGSCVDLFKKGLITTGLELVAGLGPCQECSRDFPLHWLEVLFGLVELPLDLVLTQTSWNIDESQNGCCANGKDHTNTDLVDGLLSLDHQKRSFAKQQLQHTVLPWIKGSSSTTQVVCQGLAAAQQLMQQASSRHISHVLHWLKLSINLLHNCISPNDHSAVKFHGNQRVLKALLEFIESFAEVQKSKDILEGTEFFVVYQLFDDVVEALLQLIESSETSEAVTSTSLKTLGKVFGAAKPTYITKLFNNSDIQTDSEILGEKRARLDHHLQNSNTKTSNREKLAFMLYRRLRDSSWEVRDSTLEFVADLVQLDQDLIEEFFCFHNIPAIVWNTVNDSDSYARASALLVTGSLACRSKLWTSLLQNSQLSEELILEKLSTVLVEDEEALPRRRAMECLTLWTRKRHPIAVRIIRSSKEVKDQSPTEGSPTCDDIQELQLGNQSKQVGKQSVAAETTSRYGITTQRICRACQDFDWEVKLRGFEYWEAVICHITGLKPNKESTNTRKTYDGERLNKQDVDECLRVLFEMGALKIFSEALSDCDHMVCEKSLKVLGILQHIANQDNSIVEQWITTLGDFQEALGNGFGLEKFKEVLLETDLASVALSCEAADNALRSDPVSLLEDVLLAARHHEENLLDCY